MNKESGARVFEIEGSCSDEFLLLVTLYEPSLLIPAKALADSEAELRRHVMTKLSELAAPKSDTRKILDEFNTGAFRLAETVETAYATFMKELATKFVDYRV